MLTYALTMTFICGMVFGVLLILSIAELMRRHEAKKALENFSDESVTPMPFNVLNYDNVQ